VIRLFGPSRIRNCRYFPDAETAERAAWLGVVVNTQPAWYYQDGDALIGALGASRIDSFIGLKAWQRAGVKVAINSDHMQGFDPTASLNPGRGTSVEQVNASLRFEPDRLCPAVTIRQHSVGRRDDAHGGAR
jgi:predicted amidohydrolase YtcJ